MIEYRSMAGGPVEALTAALAQVGVGAEASGRPSVDTVLVRPGPAAAAVAVRVRGTAAADPLRVSALIRESGAVGRPTVLVADRIPEPSRTLLHRAGWGWLDRRGHLRLQAPGLIIDTAVRADPRRDVRLRPGIRGVGGLTWACSLLLESRQPVLRDVARRAGLAPSTLAAAARALRDAGLAEPSPELFWAVAGQWRPEWVGLADPAALDDRRQPAGPWVGAAVSGLEAAVSWGAGSWGAGSWGVNGDAAGPGWPRRVYRPDRKALNEVIETYGELRGGRGAALAVAVPPTPLVMAGRVVAPLFAALDLAAEPRGLEVLAGWRPPGPGRAWWSEPAP